MSTELYSVVRGENGPWRIICNECGWIVFAISPEVVVINGVEATNVQISQELENLKQTHYCVV